VDLGKWFGEEYRIPGRHLGEDAEEPPPGAEEDDA
jgi:endogenous inhibitor of DNA gyrase (YacG/DUF329 family)